MSLDPATLPTIDTLRCGKGCEVVGFDLDLSFPVHSNGQVGYTITCPKCSYSYRVQCRTCKYDRMLCDLCDKYRQQGEKLKVATRDLNLTKPSAADTFVEEFLNLAGVKPKIASDHIFDFFETHFEKADFVACERALRLLSESDFSQWPHADTTLVAVLAATQDFRDHEDLPQRRRFATRAIHHLQSVLGERQTLAIQKIYE